MKTIFLTLGEDIIARNIYYTYFWPEFKKNNRDNNIVILVKPEKKEFFSKIFSDTNINVESYAIHRCNIIERLVLSLARSSIKTNTNLWSKMRSYKRGDSGFIATWFKRTHAFLLGNQNWYKRFIRFVIIKFKSDNNLISLYDKYKPDVLFATSLSNYGFDVPIAKEAKRRGLKIIGMIRSWDGLSSHGLVRVAPDFWILQNEFLKDMAIKHQVAKANQVEVVGIPYYDFFLDKSLRLTREEYCRLHNLDPDKKIILYCGMGDFLFKREGDFIDIFEEIMEEGKIVEPAQIIYSAHPKFLSSIEKVKASKHLQIAPKVTYTNEEHQVWEQELVHTKNLINLIYHADVLVMGASTMAIDAAVLDRPVVCIGYDGLDKNMNYWESVKRFYDLYTHFEALLECKGVKVAYSQDELINYINSYLKNSSQDNEGRKRIINLLVSPYEGNSGKRLERVVTKEINKL